MISPDRLIGSSLVCVLAATLTSVVVDIAGEVSNAGPASLCVMSYNLRFASSVPPNAWSQRRPLMREAIRSVSPDIIGTQEGLLAQLRDLASDLPEYEWIGTGRDGGTKGEFVAVFYRRTRLQPLATNHFWLSDTPEVVASSTWGNSSRRMVTQLRFRDLKSRREFHLLNTHFDNEVQLAREKSAALIRERVAMLNDALPVLLTGDFNAAAGSNPAYDILAKGGLSDLWRTAAERKGAGINTFNGFNRVSTNDVRIDWILGRGVVAERAETLTFARDGQFPSDHFPVSVWLHFEPQD